MVIYLDILFLVNAIVTYLLIISTAVILKVHIARWRVFISSFAGGVYSFSIFLNINPIFGFFIKTAVCFILVIISFGFRGIKQILKNSMVFLAVNFVFAGIILAASYIFKSNDFYSNMYVSYININPVVLIVFAVIAYILVFIFEKYILTYINRSKFYCVSVYISGREYKLNAYMDTGNSLTEPFSGNPVIIIKSGIIDFKSIAFKRVIPYEVLNTSGILSAVKPEKIKICWDNKFVETSDVYIAENDNLLRNSNYDLILNPRVLSEKETRYVS